MGKYIKKKIFIKSMNFLLLSYKFQYFAQSQQNCARSHDPVTTAFRKSVALIIIVIVVRTILRDRSVHPLLLSTQGVRLAGHQEAAVREGGGGRGMNNITLEQSVFLFLYQYTPALQQMVLLLVLRVSMELYILTSQQI